MDYWSILLRCNDYIISPCENGIYWSSIDPASTQYCQLPSAQILYFSWQKKDARCYWLFLYFGLTRTFFVYSNNFMLILSLFIYSFILFSLLSISNIRWADICWLLSLGRLWLTLVQFYAVPLEAEVIFSQLACGRVCAPVTIRHLSWQSQVHKRQTERTPACCARGGHLEQGVNWGRLRWLIVCLKWKHKTDRLVLQSKYYGEKIHQWQEQRATRLGKVG